MKNISIILIVVALVFTSNLFAQDYDARISLTDFDCNSNTATYSFMIKSVKNTWNLGEQNIRLFYNANNMVANGINSGIDLKNEIYNIGSVEHLYDVTQPNKNLGFDDHIGFVEFAIARKNLLDPGVEIIPTEWREIAKVDFLIKDIKIINGYDVVIGRDGFTDDITKAFTLATSWSDKKMYAGSKLRNAYDAGLSSDSENFNELCLSLGITDDAEQQITVGPIPSSDYVEMTLGGAMMNQVLLSLEVYTVDGKLVNSVKVDDIIKNNNIKIPIFELNKATYVLKADFGDSVYCSKIVKI